MYQVFNNYNKLITIIQPMIILTFVKMKTNISFKQITWKDRYKLLKKCLQWCKKDSFVKPLL